MSRWRLLELVNFIATELHKGFGPLFRPDLPDGMRRTVLEQLSHKFAFLDRQLGEKPYLTGEAFTIADAYAFVPLIWSKRLTGDAGISPRLNAYRDRIAARPAVGRALAQEGLA
jgi:glutathione S-transferase